MHHDYWDGRAERYDADTEKAVGPDILGAISRAILDGSELGDVVELGCGTGRLTAECAPHARTVTATDLSPAMVEVARERLASLGNVTVGVIDASSTRLPDGCADTVIAVNLIHIVPNPEAILVETRRILRPGGTLRVSSISTHRVPLLRKATMALRALRRFGMGFLRRRRDLTLGDLSEMVAATGFEVRESALLTGTRVNAVYVRAAKPEAQSAS